MFDREKDERDDTRVHGEGHGKAQPDDTLGNTLARKSFFETVLPVFACGAGLFSDGYINNVSVSFVLHTASGSASHAHTRFTP